MIFFLVLFVGIVLFKIKYNSEGFNDYLSKEQTISIKGIFTIIIFFSHFNTYITLSNRIINNIYLKIIFLIGQLMVAIFLFYSGYGIYYSANVKKDYIKMFPKNRILKTLVNFDLAVLLFLIVDIFLGIKYGIKEIFLSFISWESVRK